MLEATQELDFLETRYHELHRFVKAARLELVAVDDRTRRAAQRRVDEAEREKREILLRIAEIEGKLVEEGS